MNDEKKTPLVEWPADEELPSEEELRAAAELAVASDRLLAQPGLPGARSPASGDEAARETSDLLATAASIHASTHDVALPRARRDALIDEALREFDAVRRVRPLRRLAPLLALAAALLLALAAVLGGFPGRGPRDRAVPRNAAATALPSSMLSRPSNDLLGRPITDRAGASRRLDQVFASRLAGYRALRLRRLEALDGRSR